MVYVHMSPPDSQLVRVLVTMVSSYLMTTLMCAYHWGRPGVVGGLTVPTTEIKTPAADVEPSTRATKWWYKFTMEQIPTSTVIWELDPDFTTDLNMLVNDRVKKNQSHPIVDHAIIDHMKDMNAYCRCWKSKKFPLCDGAHNLHNNRTGDNVGPIFIKEPHLLNNSLEFYNHMCDLKKKK